MQQLGSLGNAFYEVTRGCRVGCGAAAAPQTLELQGGTNLGNVYLGIMKVVRRLVRLQIIWYEYVGLRRRSLTPVVSGRGLAQAGGARSLKIPTGLSE